jgi:hypothetical protein
MSCLSFPGHLEVRDAQAYAILTLTWQSEQARPPRTYTVVLKASWAVEPVRVGIQGVLHSVPADTARELSRALCWLTQFAELRATTRPSEFTLPPPPLSFDASMQVRALAYDAIVRALHDPLGGVEEDRLQEIQAIVDRMGTEDV